MGLEASLFTPDKSPYRQATLRSFLGSRLASSPGGRNQEDLLAALAPTLRAQRPPTAPQMPSSPQSAMALPNMPAATPAGTTGAGPNLQDLQSTGAGYNYDPILAEIMAVTGFDDAQAKNAALEGRRNVLLDYGDKSLASKVLGANDPTVGAINDDPEKSMSTLARLARAYKSTVKENEDALNEANLFYGGYRGQRLSDLAKQNLEGQTDAARGVQDALKQIGDALLAKQNDIRDRLLAAREQAYRDRLSHLPPGATGLDSNGNPIYPPGSNNGPGPPHFQTPDGDDVSFTAETTNSFPGMTWDNANWHGVWNGGYSWDGSWTWTRKDGGGGSTGSTGGNDGGFDPWFHP